MPARAKVVHEMRIQATGRVAIRSLSRLLLTWVVVVAVAAAIFCLGGFLDYLIYQSNL
jgi:hypothetical protein